MRGLEALSLALPPTPGQSIVRRPKNENLFSIGSVFADKRDEVEDDHFPFLEAGIPSTDLIDLMTYPYWHNQVCCDDLTQVEERSLKIVGDVIVAAVPDIEKYLLK